MEKEISPEDLELLGNHLAQLVTFKADALNEEFNAMINDGEALDAILVMADIPDDEMSATRALCISHLNTIVCSFQRRVLEPTKVLPLLLLRMASPVRRMTVLNGVQSQN